MRTGFLQKMVATIAIGLVGLVIDVLLRRVQQSIETRRGL